MATDTGHYTKETTKGFGGFPKGFLPEKQTAEVYSEKEKKEEKDADNRSRTDAEMRQIFLGGLSSNRGGWTQEDCQRIQLSR